MSEDSKKATTFPRGEETKDSAGREAKKEEKKVIIPGVTLFPTEDRTRFVELREDLLDELDPEGIQQEIVASRIVKLYWRLLNLSIFRDAEYARRRFVPIFGQETCIDALVASSIIMDVYDGVHTDKFRELWADSAKKAQEELARRAAEPINPAANDHSKSADPASSSDSKKGLHERYFEMRKIFGLSVTKDLEEKVNDGLPIELAVWADIATQENYLAELKIAAEIESAIDKNRDRLRRLKEEKRNDSEAFNRRSRIFP